MDIKHGKQIEIENISEQDISLFLFAVNHEKRAYTAYNRINKVNSIKKSIALCYNDYFKIEETSKLLKHTIKSPNEVSKLLDNEFSNLKNDDIKIVIDYSCMTKPWYYTMILYLKKKKTEFNSITVYFIYTPSKHEIPQKPKPNSEIAPLPGKYIVPTDKPKALIVCLGYEQSKAEGIIEHLDPKECFLFYSKPALDDEFVKKIEQNNSNILLENKNIITFPLNNLLILERELTSLYYLLKDDYHIIIAPLGPKPFTFMSMLLSIKHREIDIWRVGSGPDINEYNREPINNDTFIISEVLFVKNIGKENSFYFN
tara:strand:- start:890 stop:1831 length:942 start_codon:yes stop_codon:yes gene_type:complete